MELQAPYVYFFEGISEIPKPLDPEQNKKYEDARNKQRTQERQIRANKRQLQGLQSAIDNTKDEKLKFELQQSYDRKVNSLTNKNKKYKEFCRSNDLKTDSERLRVAKWDRESSRQALQGYNRYNSTQESEFTDKIKAKLPGTAERQIEFLKEILVNCK